MRLFGAVVLVLVFAAPAQAQLQLPTVRQCVTANALTLRLDPEREWTRATVTVDGKRFKRVDRPGRLIRLRKLPATPFVLELTARTNDGRRMSATRRYHPCPPGRPAATIPPGAPPAQLQTRDLVVGTGVHVRRHRNVAIRYALMAWSTRKVVDESWPDTDPFVFPFNDGIVIEGLERGLEGMRVGGRRELVIPPDLAYGEEGADQIAPNETLVMVVDLIRVERS